MAQKTIFGEHVAEFKANLSEWMRRMGKDPSSHKQRVYIAKAPETDAFIHDAVEITKLNPMWKRFLRWLDELPALESICRASRPSKQDDGHAETRRPLRTTPKWYSDYLRTAHVEQLRQSAFVHYGGCVLCGSIRDLRLHHRHYNSLGNELTRDVSVLCEQHHNGAHRLLGLSVPRQCPDQVRRILDKEKGK